MGGAEHAAPALDPKQDVVERLEQPVDPLAEGVQQGMGEAELTALLPEESRSPAQG
jgi:hypothetical protein